LYVASVKKFGRAHSSGAGRAKTQAADGAGRARLVCDYIAGMTDRFAIEEHRKLFHMDAWS
jgi:dGTP triphosphohydrolase